MTAEDLRLIRSEAEFRRIWASPNSHAGKDAVAVLGLLDQHNQLLSAAERLLMVLADMDDGDISVSSDESLQQARESLAKLIQQIGPICRSS